MNKAIDLYLRDMKPAILAGEGALRGGVHDEDRLARPVRKGEIAPVDGGEGRVEIDRLGRSGKNEGEQNRKHTQHGVDHPLPPST